MIRNELQEIEEDKRNKSKVRLMGERRGSVRLGVARVPFLRLVHELLRPVLEAPLDGGAGRQGVVDDVVAGLREEVLALVCLAIPLLQSLDLDTVLQKISSNSC